MNSDCVRELLLKLGRRAGCKRAAAISHAVSTDRDFLFRRERPISIEQVAAILESFGCNLMDLALEMKIRPSIKKYSLLNSLRDDGTFKKLPKELDLTHSSPEKVVATLEKLFPCLSNQAIFEGAFLLAPALRAVGRADDGIALLSWLMQSNFISQADRAQALQLLAYSLGSVGRMRSAARTSLEAQHLHRLFKNREKIAQGNVDNAIFRFHLGDFKAASRGFHLALESRHELNHRNVAAALYGLAMSALELKDAGSVQTAMNKISELCDELSPLDKGKVLWGQARLSRFLGKVNIAVNEFRRSLELLIENRSEDSFKVFLEMISTVYEVSKLDKDQLTKLAYRSAQTPEEHRQADRLIRSHHGSRKEFIGNLQIAMEETLRAASAAQQSPPPSPITNDRIRKVLLDWGKRSGFSSARDLSYEASPDPGFLYRRNRSISIEQVGIILERLGGNLSDLSIILGYKPTYRSWKIVLDFIDALANGTGIRTRRFTTVVPHLDALILLSHIQPIFHNSFILMALSGFFLRYADSMASRRC